MRITGGCEREHVELWRRRGALTTAARTPGLRDFGEQGNRDLGERESLAHHWTHTGGRSAAKLGLQCPADLAHRVDRRFSQGQPFIDLDLFLTHVALDELQSGTGQESLEFHSGKGAYVRGIPQAFQAIVFLRGSRRIDGNYVGDCYLALHGDSAPHFGDDLFRVGYVMKREARHHDIEGGISKGQVLGVPLEKRQVADVFGSGSRASLLHHSGGEVKNEDLLDAWRYGTCQQASPTRHVESNVR